METHNQWSPQAQMPRQPRDKTIAIIAVLILLVILTSGLIDLRFNIPGVSRFLAEAAEVPADTKDGADDTVASVTARFDEPLVVDLESVVEEAVSGSTSFGRVEREIAIGDAFKKYTSRGPRNDEWVHLLNGTFVFKAFVPGPVRWEVDGTNVTLNFDAPLLDEDLSTRVEPKVFIDPQFFAELGQIPGKETAPDKTKNELTLWLRARAQSDDELRFAASCWAIESAYEVLKPELLGYGFEIIEVEGRVPDIPIVLLDRDQRLQIPPDLVAQVSNKVKLLVQAYFAPADLIGPPAPLTRSDCRQVIAETRPDGYNGAIVETIQLPVEVIDSLELSGN